MKVKRTLGIASMILGAAMIFTSNYIEERVQEGKQKIEHAQQQVQHGNTLFSLTPATQEIGKGISGSVQKKIDKGKALIDKYDTIGGMLQIGGVLLLIVGVVFAFLSMRHPKNP